MYICFQHWKGGKGGYLSWGERGEFTPREKRLVIVLCLNDFCPWLKLFLVACAAVQVAFVFFKQRILFRIQEVVHIISDLFLAWGSWSFCFLPHCWSGLIATAVQCIYGLETVVSVLFSNTRTCLLYNEWEIFSWVQYWKFLIHCTVSKCVYLKTKHELTVSNPFNFQSEFTAGDDLQWLPAQPEHCTHFYALL